ncbi:MAG: Sua5/YciO/YrdC/YwlC family protein [Myxococcota bacterium]
MVDITRSVYDTIRQGGLALVPTTAGYGLLAMRAAAVERLYQVKGRPPGRPCVTVATWPIFDAIAAGVDPAHRAWAEQIAREHPLALVTRFDAAAVPIARMEAGALERCTKDGTLASFHRAGALVCGVAELAFADGELVVGSSANASGAGNSHQLDEVPEQIRAAADVTVDQGRTPLAHLGRAATTILDLTTGTFLRRGLQFEAIAQRWERVGAPLRGAGHPSVAEVPVR